MCLACSFSYLFLLLVWLLRKMAYTKNKPWLHICVFLHCKTQSMRPASAYCKSAERKNYKDVGIRRVIKECKLAKCNSFKMLSLSRFGTCSCMTWLLIPLFWKHLILLMQDSLRLHQSSPACVLLPLFSFTRAVFLTFHSVSGLAVFHTNPPQHTQYSPPTVPFSLCYSASPQ